MTDLTPEEKSKRADAAQILLNSDAFRFVMEELELVQIAQFADSEPDGEKARHDAYFMLRALKEFRTKLTTMAGEKAVQKRREESRRLHS